MDGGGQRTVRMMRMEGEGAAAAALPSLAAPPLALAGAGVAGAGVAARLSAEAREAGRRK